MILALQKNYLLGKGGALLEFRNNRMLKLHYKDGQLNQFYVSVTNEFPRM